MFNGTNNIVGVCDAALFPQRFTNEDHLAVHKHKHEMTLRFGPARSDSVIIAGEYVKNLHPLIGSLVKVLNSSLINWLFFADQTPTPTRFLKNCEEVGLFNELASPFEHDFKKATEEDIKKVHKHNLQCES